MPGPLRAFADHQPLTATVYTIRPLLLGGPTAPHAVVAIIWCVGIVVAFAPLCAQIPSGRLVISLMITSVIFRPASVISNSRRISVRTVSTARTAEGRERDSVRIGPGLGPPPAGDDGR
jgi:hypothetical protein